MKMLFIADANGWPIRLVSETHEGQAPSGHVVFDDLRAMSAWQDAHPELAPPKPDPEPEPVPEEIPMWALKEVCLLRGHSAEIEAAFAKLPQPQQGIARNRWENKETLSRGSTHIEAMRKLMGWTNDYADELFRAASVLAQ